METESALASGFEAVRAVANAIMYEGYLLYPYRRSSPKNHMRWQFGVLVPRTWAEAHGHSPGVAGSAESWWQRTECLLEADQDTDQDIDRDITVWCRIRFLQLQHRSVEERQPDGTYHPVDSLTLGADPQLSFDEATPREFDLKVRIGDVPAEGRRWEIHMPGGADMQPLTDPRGRAAGRVSLRRWPVQAAVVVSATVVSAGECQAPTRLIRLRVHIENTDTAATARMSREEALRTSLISCHTLLAARGGVFVSLLEPPDWAEPAARACSNVHTFPVLAGGGRDLVLSSPILLYDYPRIAPESAGDLHDATEIDEILSLRTLTLTDAEKQEARATDPRAAAIVDRVDAMSAEVFSRLHGTVRSMTPSAMGDHTPDVADVADAPDVADTAGVRAVADIDGFPEPWWRRELGSESPEVDAVHINGTRVRKGSRVRLRPRSRGTDPQDAFLNGRVARVEAVLIDVDDKHHLAVTLEDDPGADLDRWYGRFRYFSPLEVDPLVELDPLGEDGEPR